jgi:DNA-binding PadR family transcriptional regulator
MMIRREIILGSLISHLQLFVIEVEQVRVTTGAATRAEIGRAADGDQHGADEGQKAVNVTKEQVALLSRLAKKACVYKESLPPELREMEEAGLVTSSAIGEVDGHVGFITESGHRALEQALHRKAMGFAARLGLILDFARLALERAENAEGLTKAREEIADAKGQVTSAIKLAIDATSDQDF